MNKLWTTLLIFVLAVVLGGCSALSNSGGPTPLPAAFLPTAIALTRQADSPGLTPQPVNDPPQPADAPATAETGGDSSIAPAEEEAPMSAAPGLTPTSVTPAATATPAFTATPTQFPEIYDAEIQINRMGDLSRVTSPFLVSAYLSSHIGKIARTELYGEDGRLLARDLRTFTTIPWNYASHSVEMEFEISAPAEVGRLAIIVEDVFGRVMAVNSVNLILLSVGSTELNPPTALLEAIVIQEPTPQTLIQGGTVLVTGLARPDTDRPLHVELISEDGRQVGQRLVSVERLLEGAHGTFAVEVPYNISETTPVRLVVYEYGEMISPYIHLSSLEVVLNP
ncbi:MAG TPA: Gmad2 immunoglobulin-like domain-containing protein [Anaerolineales bacterium]|nr:Gmad2 immunoglobulin-like domain-containing protein [Anaerolineales bacterium]